MSPRPLEVACALILRRGRLLLGQRADNGLWELPGGKQEPDEDLPSCLAREIREELDAEVEVLEPLAVAEIREPEFALRLHCFRCRLIGGEPRALEHRRLMWAAPDQLEGLDLCPADRDLAGRLLRELDQGRPEV